MDLNLQPKPEVEFLPANRGIVSRKQFFVKKKFEKIDKYFFSGHLIRSWRPKADLIYPSFADECAIQYEYDFNRDVQNCFVEDYAEEVYLRTPPPCFVIIGKCGQSTKKFSEELARQFGSVLIQVDDIVNEVIKRKTETSTFLERILRLGVSLTLNFILTLLSYVAHTAEARHRGYVLCGLPRVPLLHDLSADQQFNYLFTWENKPTIFINVLFDDEDLIEERTNLFCEVKTRNNETFILYHSEWEKSKLDGDETDEDEDDDLLPIKEDVLHEPDIDISPSRPWVRLPKDEESQVWFELELFDNNIRPAIELINSRVDPQYFITVDSRVGNEFEVVLARLRLLQIWKVPVARLLIEPPRDNDVTVLSDVQHLRRFTEDEIFSEVVTKKIIKEPEPELDFDINDIIGEPPETAFLKIFSKKTLSSKFRWELSHYNYICPVSLRNGEILEGKSEFAVLFMKYIYFLRDEESAAKFIQNPRAYVLPIRPKPLCRFFVLGYPYSGKTTLAHNLADEFSIPVINFNRVLKNDLDRKKYIYQEFCRQKAECRETIRLTCEAWFDWRTEEENRLRLIEDWILFIQILLSRRIKEFYSSGSEGSETTLGNDRQKFSPLAGSIQEDTSASDESFKCVKEKTSLEVRRSISENKNAVSATSRLTNAVAISASAAKNVQFSEYKNLNLNEENQETRPSLFLKALWRSFSSVKQRSLDTFLSEEFGEYEGNAYDQFEFDDESDEIDSVDWCSLLPPQSVSSFMLSKIPYTTREKRQSFHIFLEAASKVYWEHSALKSQFVKWRIPCFMNIPLCEILLDNPLLLLKYIPDWLKERPLIPDPIDPTHPSILEAGRAAFLRAECVTITQNQEEVGTLLRNAIEKAEREGMRVTGEVISPGGWVIDDMTLDLNIWNRLASENIFADHIYILIDSESECRRIMNMWWDLCGRFRESNISINDENLSEEETEEPAQKVRKLDRNPFEKTVSQDTTKSKTVAQLLIESAKAIADGEEQLDAIYRSLVFGNDDSKNYSPLLSVDPFCLNMLQNIGEIVKDDSANEEALVMTQSFSQSFSKGLHLSNLIYCTEVSTSFNEFSLGVQLEIFTENLMSALKKKKPKKDEFEILCNESFANSLEFFAYLLTLPEKLHKLKEWLNSVGRDFTAEEIDITGKSQDQILSDIKVNLMKPFIKKPRELENFEIEEINIITEKEFLRQTNKLKEESEAESFGTTFKEDEDEDDDVRIFGESGKICIVNLEKDLFLYGNPNYALRYYGKLYYFFDQDSKNKFIENPEKYAPYYSVIRSYPPIRAFVMGPIGSGKTELAKLLGNQCSITNVNYLQYITQSLVPHLDFPNKKFTAIGDKTLLLGENHSAEAKLAKEHFMNVPPQKRMYWLESSFYSDFVDIENFFDKIFQKAEPIVFKDFPDLTYMTIESLTEENGEDYSNLLSKTDVALSETPYISMKEIDPIVTNYFHNNSDLNDYLLYRSLKVLWTQEPYITKGFILEGFPLRVSDIQTLVKNNWIPDVVIEITAEEEDVIKFNIEPLMEFWDSKLKQDILEENLIEDSLHSLQRTFIALRRNELLREKREELIRIMETQSNSIENNQFRKTQNGDENMIDDPFLKSEKSEDLKISKTLSKPSIKKYEKASDGFEPVYEFDSEIVEEVDKILKEKYPLFVFNPVFENYDAAKARIITNLTKSYKTDMNEIDKAKAILKQVDVTWVSISGLPMNIEVVTDLYLSFNEIKKPTKRKGELAFTVSMNMAEKLLEQGFYFLSKFGRWCPVQVYRMKNPIHMFRPLYAKGKITPIAYRNYIYFVAGKNEQRIFMEDPIKYIFNEPHHPNIPLRIAIIGPPKSGKSTLCRRLKTMFDLKIITMGSALRFVLEKTPRSTLAKSISNYLERGCFLPLSLKVEALMVCLNDPSCVTQGFVLDGMPFDAASTQSLAEKGKLPFVIINLTADSYFGKTNRQKLDLKQFRLPYKNRTNLDSRYNDWNQTYKRFAQWNQDTYNNLYEVNAKLSVVDIFYQAYDIIRKSFFGILYYVEYCVSDRALPLQYLCVSQHEYELRKSSFHNNCPVCWVELNRLNSSLDPPPRSGLVQYLNHFYWICPKHFEKFIESPKKYFPPNAKEWPKLFPKMLTGSELEKNLSHLKIHGYGRCPVTRTDFPSHLDWEGSYDFAALYDNEIYLCKNKEMLDRFLAMPWKYCGADTQFEVNRPVKSNAVEELGPPKLTSLPPIGFLEQTVADLIHECLQFLGVVRPLYPNIPPEATGCTFVGLYLKVNNLKNKRSHLEKEYLDHMIRHCHPNLFLVSSVRYPQDREEIKDFSLDEVIDSESSVDYTTNSDLSIGAKKSSSDPCWLDPELQTDKKMWSAACVSEKFTLMKITSKDNLIEIPEVPKTNVVLNYQTYTLRSNPIPPVSNCLTFIYSCKRNLKLPEKFNCDSLYQPVNLFSPPFVSKLVYNPDKQFAITLYNENKPSFPSEPDVRNTSRVIPDPISEEIKSETQIDPVLKLLTEDFFPRFQLLDKIKIPEVPSIPKASENQAMLFNPHREYTYTILFSEFFCTTQVLRCYEWSEISRFLEYSNRLEKNLGLTKVRVNYLFSPQKPASMKSRTSLDSYQQIFDAASKFVVPSEFSDYEEQNEESHTAADKSSLNNFLQMLILEKLNEIFEKISVNSFSYDAFEINVVPSENNAVQKKKVTIRETLPYPPLPWDIINRPYYSYLTLSSIFEIPPLDNIAHKRHISLLDGLTELADDLRFVPYPSSSNKICEKQRALDKSTIAPFYFVYDFFNIPWTSFLTYPYSMAYNIDITYNISSEEEG